MVSNLIKKYRSCYTIDMRTFKWIDARVTKLVFLEHKIPSELRVDYFKRLEEHLNKLTDFDYKKALKDEKRYIEEMVFLNLLIEKEIITENSVETFRNLILKELQRLYKIGISVMFVVIIIILLISLGLIN